MTSPGVLYVDETVDEYQRIKLPRNWTVHYETEWGSLQASLQWAFTNFPDATQYGWLADDTRPRTHGWDTALEQAAGNWGLAYAKDLWLSETPSELSNLIAGWNLSSGLCWGGDLVRTVGWWALPGVRQAGIDTAWTEIVRPLGLNTYRADVTVEHLHHKAGKRMMDIQDEGIRDGLNYVDRDIAFRNEWVRSVEYRNLIRRLRDLVPNADVDGALQAQRQSMVDELWSNGGDGKIPGARLQRILDGTNGVDLLDYDRVRHPGVAV